MGSRSHPPKTTNYLIFVFVQKNETDNTSYLSQMCESAPTMYRFFALQRYDYFHFAKDNRATFFDHEASSHTHREPPSHMRLFSFSLLKS